MRLGAKKVCKPKTVQRVQQKYVRFLPEQVNHVDQWLARANLSVFSAIHWRAERNPMDFMECAQSIAQAREIMNTTTTPFVLMSSLSLKQDHMWRDTSRKLVDPKIQARVQQALEFLLHNQSFIKLDDFVVGDHHVVEDPVLLSVWDLILATKAQEFATCTPGCHGICQACNHLGKFAETAVALRTEMGKRSRECWPIRPNGGD